MNISGLRAATDENREKGRRLLWVFLLTICFAVMVAQITDRVRHYLSEPVSVVVSVARNTSLTYPAITICNKVRESQLKLFIVRGRKNKRKQLYGPVSKALAQCMMGMAPGA